MNIEDIKVGETYNVRVKVEEKNDAVYIQGRTRESACSVVFSACEAEAFSPIIPENGIKNTETAPKCDPSRKFRKGDKVKLVARDGRSYIDYDPTTKLREGAFYTVLEDESDVIEGGCPDIRIADGHAEYEVLFYFLELVIPAEEIEPYRVETGGYNRFRIKKGNLEYSYFPFGEHCVLGMDEAKAAAEAERDRLNAEWRKEREIRNEIIEIDKALNKEILNHADAFLTRKEQK